MILPSFRVFFVSAACLFSTGCMISGPVGLVGGTLIRAYMAPEEERPVCGSQDGPMTVNQLLANARTLEPASGDEKTEKPVINDPVPEFQDRPSKVNSPLELSLDDKTAVLVDKIMHKYGDLSAYENRSIKIGSGGNADDKRRLFFLHEKIRNLTSALGSACDCKSVTYDPALPVGTLQLNFTKVS